MITREHWIWLRYIALFAIAVTLFMRQDMVLGWTVVAVVIGGALVVFLLRRP